MFLIYGVVFLIPVIIWVYFKWSFSYWKRKGLPQIHPLFPFGTFESPFTRTENVGARLRKQYFELKTRGCKHGGLYNFTKPVYFPLHPDYIKNIMSKDFNYFMSRGTYFNEKDDPLSAHLFNMEGHKWKNLRTKLSSTFTAGKMKILFPTLVECAKQMTDHVEGIKRRPIDVKDVFVRFAIDVIGSCAFGLDCNSFKDPNSEFTTYGKKAFEPFSKLRAVRNLIAVAKPNLARLLRITESNKECTEFFMRIVKNTVNYRESTNFTRKDFIQILIDLKNSPKTEERLTVEEVAAQAFIFFFAGFETSATTMAFCLFELAYNQHIQEKARAEVVEVLGRRDFNYDALMEMTYLGQVVDETLRKYPPAGFITRMCVKDYSCLFESDVVIEKGTRVLIPVLGLHYDSDYFPQPDLFDPDRFSEKNKKNVLPFTYMPFGEGPRICIGLRFGLTQVKVGLAMLLKNYKFKLNPETRVPLQVDPFSLVYTSKYPIWLDVEAAVDEKK